MSKKSTKNQPKIQKLSGQVIAAIAAGEIVERPAVVVKELIENALDAAATEIRIAIEDGGLKRITVTDNGVGIPADQLELAVERHTTSKIVEVKDLQQLGSFGFRGEALASIAAAADVLIQSRPKNQTHGNQLHSHFGAAREPIPLGMPPGTTVIVSDLFGQLPARRKFLHSTTAEWHKIADVITAIALSHPEIALSITHQAKPFLQLAAEQTLEERTSILFGHQTAKLFAPLLPISKPASTNSNQPTELTISGLLGFPQLARKQPAKQYLFVNRRLVTSLEVQKLVKETYGALLEPIAYPVFVLFLELPADQVDINIHPRKEKVAFANSTEILTQLRDHIAQTLQTHDISYHYQPEAGDAAAQSDVPFTPQLRTAAPTTAHLLKDLVTAWQLSPKTAPTQIVQIDKTYLAVESSDGFLLFDQHAAHERILFNEYRAALRSKQPALTTSTPLASPIVFDLPALEAETLLENLSTWQQIGFEVSPIGPQTFSLSQLPTLFSDRDPLHVLKEVLDAFLAGEPLQAIDRAAERTIAYLACRQAIKAGDTLTPKQARELLTKLSTLDEYATCPHGRPVMVKFSIAELEKMFKRR